MGWAPERTGLSLSTLSLLLSINQLLPGIPPTTVSTAISHRFSAVTRPPLHHSTKLNYRPNYFSVAQYVSPPASFLACSESSHPSLLPSIGLSVIAPSSQTDA
ncbi:hypothetical protein CRG98_049907 [Punica granatum]|uniref:Secreted protein n=1 Tax=Punica granatum TaxID=22663 RepID=A0A2I0H1L0_PUNGR|nr:hypothetical protein CRG98_049907 [Punica granatum]